MRSGLQVSEGRSEGGGGGGGGGAMDYYPAPGRNHLFVPGPTNVPEPVLRAMNRSNEDHRSPAFPKLSKSVIEDVKQLFGTTKATSFIIPTTGIWIFTTISFANCRSLRLRFSSQTNKASSMLGMRLENISAKHRPIFLNCVVGFSPAGVCALHTSLKPESRLCLSLFLHDRGLQFSQLSV